MKDKSKNILWAQLSKTSVKGAEILLKYFRTKERFQVAYEQNKKLIGKWSILNDKKLCGQ